MGLPDFKDCHVIKDNKFKEITDDTELYEICVKALKTTRKIDLHLNYEDTDLSEGAGEGSNGEGDGEGENGEGAGEDENGDGGSKSSDDSDYYIRVADGLIDSDYHLEELEEELEHTTQPEKDKYNGRFEFIGEGDSGKKDSKTQTKKSKKDNYKKTDKQLLENEELNLFGEEDINKSEDELNSAKGSDEENENDIEKKYPVRDTSLMFVEPTLSLGMKFTTKTDFRELVHSHAILTRRSIKITSNDKFRVYAKCADKDCAWRVHATKLVDEATFQIRSYVPKYTCAVSMKVQNMKSRWLAKKFIQRFKSDPKRNTKSFREDAMEEIRCHISTDQAYRAKRTTIQIIQGNPDDQYALLWDYYNEIKRINPGSTVILGVQNAHGENLFDRFYVCLNALKVGFKNGCRPLIGVDGCHLKGPHQGVLLTAVAIDPNNNIYPIAWTVIQKESGDTWDWFLTILKIDLYIENPTLDRAFFSTDLKCDMLLNNGCECFNNSILHARELPIISMLEWIMEFYIKRLQVNRDKAKTKWKGELCPKIKKIIDNNVLKMGGCFPIKSDDMHYMVRSFDGTEQYTVDLENYTCGCRKWDISGIPCKHACSAINVQGLQVEEFVHKSYTVETYLKVYGLALMPINGRNEWKKSDFIPPIPPNGGRESGRPPVARRMEVDEVQTKKKERNKGRKDNPFRLKRQYAIIKCRKCGGEGHNKANKRCPLFNQEIPTQEDLRSQVSFEDAPPASTYANPTDFVSATARKKLKVKKRKVTSVKPHQEGQSSKVAFMRSTNTTNKGATKAAKKQKTVSSALFTVGNIKDANKSKKVNGKTTPLPEVSARIPPSGMSTKTRPPLKKNLKKANSGLESSNKPGLQLRDESDEDNINLEAPDFVPYPDYLQTTPPPERPSATASKKANAPVRAVSKRPKAPIPAVPKRPNALERPSATERPTATSSTSSQLGPSMFSQLQQGQKKGVNIREPLPFFTRQVIHSLPGSRREAYGTFITKEGEKKFVALSDMTKTNAKDKGKMKI
ncbi:hypothetical protein BUALT_Bualt18G0011900 [Buddleja alternifolia]|uniref:SWIM-type domain-containing protein n=1 Tax=Buddleja alternifolia TaxID=168488 RepID=A0AAV6W3S6_9LAMI|nr:hypothetical protein BUALT_Bualt18G0011900 [Buddleja alternifolia]